MRTFIKWYGNKQKYVGKILAEFPAEYNRYVEPFLGSGAVFLALEPRKWILNDLNKDLIGVWNLVRDDPNAIITAFRDFSKRFKRRSRQSKIGLCRTLTDKLNTLPAGPPRYIDYLLMKYCCYMGAILQNDKFYFSGLELNIESYFFLRESYYQNLLTVSEFLNSSPRNKIFSIDYKKILEKTREGDLVFLDPPYMEDDVSYKFQYNVGEKIGECFMETLAVQLQKLDERRVKWIMTQADTPQIRELFKQYTIREFCVYRNKARCYKTELIIKNFS